ncbi:DUF4436 domain-containing protein [Candidatus Mycobacterium methanotrophicum]|uniref:DUF4436 domain-containing protein n=1 Tax=Candidatus Mycobacterium methanotrophicum TaxID=2943498 RepID=A0ABY4QLX4_9MYCO|nr:DUF4436 domain-containing protein [Candidatus Mycobacterium methanotrophicum]UQX11606.1 DUF4436 domain-containing protein [Candidatus Mycobacterium methanotrophicum]
MSVDAPPTAPPSPRTEKQSRRGIVIGLAILLTFFAAYGLSLLGFRALQRSEGPLPPLDLSQAGPDETVVQIRLQELKPTTNRLTVNVLIYPGDSLYDKRFDELSTDIAVRLYPANDLGDLQFPKGKAPAQVNTTIEAHGNPGSWPFDSYRTEPQSADVFVGTGAERERMPAVVQVTGSMDGWDAAVKRNTDKSETGGHNNSSVVITLQRAKGPLIFDLGIIMVLVTLPTLALLVAIPMAMGRRKFVPPFATWYAANLFAIVPLRNILPGAPPAGSMIDQALVQWVLLALATATALYVYSWVRHGD